MTPDAARSTANVLLATAAGAVVFLVLRNRGLRRAAGRVLWIGLTSTLPRMLASDASDAWAASAPGHRP